MSPEVLETYIKSYLASQPGPEVQFAWQGGEPTLLGLPTFRKIVEWQEKYAAGKKVSNALQTNGTLLNDDWARFLKEQDFLVGISIDGPRHLHDAYRLDRCGKPTFDAVMRGLKCLRKHGVQFNTLTVLNRKNAQHPGVMYDFLKKSGSTFWQFIPVVERRDERGLVEPGKDSADEREAPVTNWSVRAEDYGQFMNAIFDRWVKEDVGRIFVQAFDDALGKWLGQPAGICVHAKECGRALAIEFNGDVYSCDHFVYPSHRLGNFLETDLEELVLSPQQKKFGRSKSENLAPECKQCPWLFACAGGCPKHRFLPDRGKERRGNYLCAGYRKFFAHVDPAMRTMGLLWKNGHPPARIMETGILT